MVLASGPAWLATATITMTTGTLFLMWLGEQITERGIGNGISMLILSGIVAGLPAAVGNTFRRSAPVKCRSVLPAARDHRAGRDVFRGVRGARAAAHPGELCEAPGRPPHVRGQSSHLPFKINMSGVIPPIFASSILLFPATIANFFGSSATGKTGEILQKIANSLGYGQPAHLVVYALLICSSVSSTRRWCSTRVIPRRTCRSPVRSSRHPSGQQSGDYIDKVLSRLTLWGALYVALVCLLPEFLVSSQGVPFQFGGTSLMIVVVVVMDFMSQLQAHMMSHQYPGLLKHARRYSPRFWKIILMKVRPIR